MRLIVTLVASLLTGCVAVESDQRIEPEYGITYTTEYVNNLNWYMLYMFAYTRSVNEYAMQHGWQPPTAAPICRLIPWPTLAPLPNFQPTYRGDSPRAFEIELGEYVRLVKRAYRNGITDLAEAERIQRLTCIY